MPMVADDLPQPSPCAITQHRSPHPFGGDETGAYLLLPRENAQRHQFTPERDSFLTHQLEVRAGDQAAGLREPKPRLHPQILDGYASTAKVFPQTHPREDHA